MGLKAIQKSEDNQKPKIKKRFKRWTINITVLVASVVFIFLVMEISVGIFVPPYRIVDAGGRGVYVKDEELEYKMKPNFKGTYTGAEFAVEFSTNPQGFRSSEFNINDSNIILMLGDSITMGHGVEKNETVSYILQNELENYKIYNLGVSGYSLVQFEKQLEQMLPLYKPNLTIVNLYLGNDIQESCGLLVRKIDEFGYRDDNIVDPDMPLLQKGTIKIKLVLAKSKAIVFFYTKWRQLYQKSTGKHSTLLMFEPTDSPIKEECYGITKDYLNEIKYSTEYYNTTLVVVFIPAYYQVQKEKIEALTKKYNIDLYLLNKKMHAICEELNLDCLDLTQTFIELDAKNQVYFPIDGHWNKRGHLFAGEKIGRYLIENKYAK